MYYRVTTFYDKGSNASALSAKDLENYDDEYFVSNIKSYFNNATNPLIPVRSVKFDTIGKVMNHFLTDKPSGNMKAYTRIDVKVNIPMIYRIAYDEIQQWMRFKN